MLTKAQMTAGLQQAALPQTAAAPVAAPAVSVFAKAKNLLNSVAVNSRTAKMAIGSIVTAAVVYATFKFATSTAKKADEKSKEQKTTDRVIAKMQEARTAAGKAVTLLSTCAKKFKEEHPVAFKVIGAALVAGSAIGIAKLLYKPAAKADPVDYSFDNINAGDGSDSRCEEHGANNINAAPFCEGDSELDPEDYNRDHLIPGMEFDAKAANEANQARMNSFYEAKTPAPVPAQTAAEKEVAQNKFIDGWYDTANALSKADEARIASLLAE